jgi:hypothetical protein
MKNKNTKQAEMLEQVLPNAQEWWRQHPNASLADIEEAIDEQLSRIRGNQPNDRKKRLQR